MPYSLRPAIESHLQPMMRIGHEGIRPYALHDYGGGIKRIRSVDFVKVSIWLRSVSLESKIATSAS